MDSPGLYVHVPFCRSRCGYCAFVSGIYDSGLADQYLAALQREMRACELLSPDFVPSTVFIGGGTPSCLSVSQMASLLSCIPRPGRDGEYTCELNPDSTDAEKLDLLHGNGVNRCSIGVQTFSAKGLRLLQRRHDATTAESVVKQAVASGFATVNLDLITAWPGQTVDELREDLRRVVDLGVSHISCYNLIVEETSKLPAILRQNTLNQLDDEDYRRYWDITEDYLAGNGFEHYETSNFARGGHRCRHNVNTWKGMTYHGVGVAAHSHIGGRRFANTDSLAEYLAVSGDGNKRTVFSETLAPLDRARECAVFWLRLYEGIRLDEYAVRTGFVFEDVYRDALPGLLDQGYLEYSRDRRYIRVPGTLHPVLDAVVVELL